MWYHAQNEEQHGPLTEQSLKELLTRREISPQTLVWREGFTEWLPLEQTELAQKFEVPLPAGDGWQTCTYSGDRVKRSQMTQLDGYWVANEHLDEAQQFLQQGGWLPRVESGEGRLGNLDLGYLIHRTKQVLSTCALPICGLYLTVAVPLQFLFAQLQVRLGTDQLDTIRMGYVLDLLISPLSSGGILFLLSQHARGLRPGFREGFLAGLRLWTSMVVTQLIVGMVTLFGFLLLIIPGLILAVRTALASPALVERRLLPAQAVKQSWEVTHDQAWRTLAYLIMVGMPCLMPSVIIGGVVNELLPGFDKTLASPLLDSLLSLPVVGFISFLFCYYKELEALQQMRYRWARTDSSSGD